MSLNEPSNRHVETATPDRAPADIDRIEKEARANVEITREETWKAERAGSDSTATNSTATVYGAIAAELLGVGTVAKLAEFADARRTDRATGNQRLETNASRSPKTMDETIVSSVTKKPGLYRESATPAHYEDRPGASTKRLASTQGEDLVARANIAKTSLQGQGKDAISSWGVRNPNMGSVAEAIRMMYGHELANEQALNAVHTARLQQQAMMKQVQQMTTPGMNMGMNGPSPSQSMSAQLAAAEDQKRMNAWRESGTA